MMNVHALAGAASSALILLTLSGCNQQDVQNYIDDLQASGRGADVADQYLEGQTGAGDAAREESEHSNGESCAITEAQQKMLDEINKARAQARSCGDEEFAAAPPVTWNCKLEQAAWAHTEDMVNNNFFSHTGSDGLHAGDRIDATGYRWKVYGENLAAGFLTEKETIDGLLNSAGHCKNIMNPKFSEFGSARMFVDGNDFVSYWTHEFGASF